MLSTTNAAPSHAQYVMGLGARASSGSKAATDGVAVLGTSSVIGDLSTAMFATYYLICNSIVYMQYDSDFVRFDRSMLGTDRYIIYVLYFIVVGSGT